MGAGTAKRRGRPKGQRHIRKADLPVVYGPSVGRPKKLTPEIEQVIVETILEGNTRGCAAARAGISYATFCTWMKRGEAAEDKPNPTDEDKEYFRFYDLCLRAEAEAHAQSVKNVVGQGRKNFQAAAWWLERRFNKDWVKKEQVEVEHSGEVTHRYKLDLSVLTTKELVALRNAIAKARGTIDVTPASIA